jgi:hypothetical protein
MVRVFDNGEIIGEIISEQWMLRHYTSHISDSFEEKTNEEIAVISKTN